MTSPPTRATRRCAARCCGRIELQPSGRLAAAWLLWLAACAGALLAGVTGPLAVRVALCLALGLPNLRALRSTVLLRGGRAVRGLEWEAEGKWRLRLGPARRRSPAAMTAASFRLGAGGLWVLWFTTPGGSRVVLIDAGRQDPVAFRRLSRHLVRGELLPSRPKV